MSVEIDLKNFFISIMEYENSINSGKKLKIDPDSLRILDKYFENNISLRDSLKKFKEFIDFLSNFNVDFYPEINSSLRTIMNSIVELNYNINFVDN